MPKIPTYISDGIVRSPGVSPGVAGAPGAALARAGQQISSSAEQFGATVSRVERIRKIADEQEKKATRDIKLSQTQNSLRLDEQDFATALRESTDMEGLVNTSSQIMEATRAKYEDRFADDPGGLQKFNNLFSVYSSSMMKLARARQRTLVVQHGKATMNENLKNALDDYSIETDPKMREIIKGNFDIKVKAGWIYLNELEQQAYRNSFTDQAESVRADKAIESAGTVEEAEAVAKSLKNLKEFNLDTDARQKKVEKANRHISGLKARDKVARYEAETIQNVFRKLQLRTHQSYWLTRIKTEKDYATLYAELLNDEILEPTEGAGSRRALLSMIETKAKSEVDPYGITNEVTKGQVSRLINQYPEYLENELGGEKYIESLHGKGLKTIDYEKYIDDFRKWKDGESDEKEPLKSRALKTAQEANDNYRSNFFYVDVPAAGKPTPEQIRENRRIHGEIDRYLSKAVEEERDPWDELEIRTKEYFAKKEEGLIKQFMRAVTPISIERLFLGEPPSEEGPPDMPWEDSGTPLIDEGGKGQVFVNPVTLKRIRWDGKKWVEIEKEE